MRLIPALGALGQGGQNPCSTTRGRDNTTPALEQVDHVHYIQQHETLSRIYTNSLYGGQLASRHI